MCAAISYNRTRLYRRYTNMSDTEGYLDNIRATKVKTTFGYFLLYFILFALALILSYLFFSSVPCGNFLVVCDVSAGETSDKIKSAISSSFPITIKLLLTYISVYTTFSRPAMAVLSVWQGISLGTVTALLSSNKLGGIGDYIYISVWLYFICALCFIAFYAMSSIYSDTLIHTSVCDDKRIFTSLSAEYTKCFLFFSGVIFLLGCASVVFIN